MIVIDILSSSPILLLLAIRPFRASGLASGAAVATAAETPRRQVGGEGGGGARAGLSARYRDLSAGGTAPVSDETDGNDEEYVPTKKKTKKMKNFKLFEGDMVPVYSQIGAAYGPNVTAELIGKGVLPLPATKTLDTEGRGGGDDDDEAWPVSVRVWPRGLRNGHEDADVVVVPYRFDPTFLDPDDIYQTESDVEYKKKAVVVRTMEILAADSGVLRFVPLTEGQEDEEGWPPYHLLFTSYENNMLDFDYYPACWSYVGYQGGARHSQQQQQNYQELNLGSGCIVSGFIHHLLLHTLGLWHTPNRPDRDSYVTILWENVLPGFEYDYRKRVREDPVVDIPYDYASTMHNYKTDFSKFGNSTAILAPEPIGNLDGPSAGDLVHLRLLYQCATGPRRYADYISEPCTEDCRCWDTTSTMGIIASSRRSAGKSATAGGVASFRCHSNDALCQGDLVCDPNTDGCVSSPSYSMAMAKGDALVVRTATTTTATTDGASSLLPRYGIVMGILVVATIVLSWKKRRSRQRDQYHPIPLS